MKIRFWGTRGGVASPSAETCELGGNTSCVQVTLDHGPSIILDCGTGLIEYASSGVDLRTSREFHFLVSHFHWDHIIGFPFFHPIHQKGVKIVIHSPFSVAMLEENFGYLFDGTYSPLRSITNLPASIEFVQLKDGRTEIQGAQVSFCRVSHTADCFGFRIEAGGDSIVYASDHECRKGTYNNGLIDFARDATVLIHDAQFYEAEYPRYTGWGHSTVEDAISNAAAAKARHVFLTHYNPGRSDDSIRLYLQKLLRQNADRKVSWPNIMLAAEDGAFFDTKG